MFLGRIYDKVTTNNFKFLVEQETKKFDYIQVYHRFYEYVLCQVIDIEKTSDRTIAKCQVIGFKDKDGKIKKLKIPFDPGSEVFKARESFISEVIALPKNKTGAYIGKLLGKDIPIQLDLNTMLTKHVAILAKSGSGKSYTVGVLLEEIISSKVPLLIIDPHGEYKTLRQANTNEEEIKSMATYNIRPQGFPTTEYADITINPGATPLKLPNTFSIPEIIKLLPAKLSNAQQSLLYSATQDLKNPDLESVIYAVSQEDNNLKWSVLQALRQLDNNKIFSNVPIQYEELLQSGSASIINLRGIEPWLGEIITYKLVKDLFERRKKEQIPPFFLVIEEAHNFCPERSFGSKKSSDILRTVASEGRKFGLGLCIVSQRPARVDKSVLSQCSTQIIMKVTNPNDLKAISNSVEGITSSAEKEIQNISVGTALITGVTEVPLFVQVRPRKSLHGGVAVDILGEYNNVNNHNNNNENNTTTNNITTNNTATTTTITNNITTNKRNTSTTINPNNNTIKNESEIKEKTTEETGQETEQKTEQEKENTANLEKEIKLSESKQTQPKTIQQNSPKSFIDQVREHQNKEMVNIIAPSISPQDLKLMSTKEIKEIETILHPGLLVICKDNNNDQTYNIFVSKVNKGILADKEEGKFKFIPDFTNANKEELLILQKIFSEPKRVEILKQDKTIGTNEDQIKQSIHSLKEKELITLSSENKLKLNKEKYIFSNLRTFSIYEQPKYQQIQFTKKEESAFSNEEILNTLKNVTHILSHKEVYLIKYNPIY